MNNSVIGFMFKTLGLFFIIGVLLWGAVYLLGFWGMVSVLIVWLCGFAAGRMTCPRVIRGVMPKDD